MPYVKYNKIINKGSLQIIEEKFIKVLPHAYFSPTLGISMPNPVNKRGKWIGWSDNETAEFLEAIRKYKDSLSYPKNNNGNGC
jgi:hypothetical protein